MRFPASDRRVATWALIAGLVSGLILLVAVALPYYATQTEAGADTCTSGVPEGSQARVAGWSWWPLGTRCVLTDGDTQVGETVVPPWQGTADW